MPDEIAATLRWQRGNATIDHLFSVKQILEKCYDVHQILVDFKQVLDALQNIV